jgi:hypothetical protein
LVQSTATYGGRNRARTCDPLIKSQLLLQRHQWFECKIRQKELFQINWIRANCKMRFCPRPLPAATATT